MSSQQQRYPHSPTPSRASLIGRQRAGQLAPTDTCKALQAARGCPDAWYRVQALASVAEHAEQRLVLRILEEAAREAQSCHDAYGTVAVMAWPLRVAFKQGQLNFAGCELEEVPCAGIGGRAPRLAGFRARYPVERLLRGGPRPCRTGVAQDSGALPSGSQLACRPALSARRGNSERPGSRWRRRGDRRHAAERSWLEPVFRPGLKSRRIGAAIRLPARVFGCYSDGSTTPSIPKRAVFSKRRGLPWPRSRWPTPSSNSTATR